MFDVVTIAREYGSGGADIGRKVAELLGWVCVDKQIIERVAVMGGVDASWAEAVDEHATGWWGEVMKSFCHGGLESYIGEGAGLEVDHDTLQQFTVKVIDAAAKEGQCVIIGRSSQFVLRHYPRVLHVLVFAAVAEKVARMKLRHPDVPDLSGLLYRMDNLRNRYTRHYFGHDWLDRGLYHLCVNSTLGIDASAHLIAEAIRSSK